MLLWMSGNDIHGGIAGILLAGGESSRLGAPKQLLEIAGEPLALRAVQTALPYCTAGFVVVTGAVHEPIAAALTGLPLTIVRNPDWEEGIGASLRCGVRATGPGAEGFLVILCDQPRVGAAELAALFATWKKAPDTIAAAGYAGSCGVPAIFPAAFRSQLEALRGDRGARAVIAAQASVTVVDMPAAAFDIDTPEDARKLINAPGSDRLKG